MRTIGFLWDNFGPTHVDACSATAAALGEDGRVVGIELYSASDTYEWGRWVGAGYDQVTVFEGAQHGRVGTFRLARAIIGICRRERIDTVFLCHYQIRGIFLAAIVLRLLGRRVFVMSDSKFDDYRRYRWREVGKAIYMLPYLGALVASSRSADYLRFLGVPESGIRLGYYCIQMNRIRAAADSPAAPNGTPHANRRFVCVARLVAKKNHLMLLDAYAQYRAAVARPHPLVLCGSGPLESAIRARIAELALDADVTIAGNLSADQIAAELARGLALILPSTSEQFGIVVLEAQAMGLPILISVNCGARDRQVRSGVNGFVVEDDNPEGLAYFMRCLSEDQALWRRMALASAERTETGHVHRLVEAVRDLAGLT